MSGDRCSCPTPPGCSHLTSGTAAALQKPLLSHWLPQALYMDTSQTEICILSFLTTLLHQLHLGFFCFFLNPTNYTLPRRGGHSELNNTDHRPRTLLCHTSLSIKVKKRSRSPLRLQPFGTAQHHLSAARDNRQCPRGFPSQPYRELYASPGSMM